ncbi:MAG: GNAT family N-acetyltransferase [bacterium]
MHSSTQFSIRQANGSDIAEIAQFNIRMAMETENLSLLPEVITQGVTNMIDHPDRGFYLVVEANTPEGAEIAASLMVTTEWSDWRNGMFWWIQSVYVLPAWRRKGLYRMMYEKVKSLADEDGNVCGFRLYVEHENEIAQHTYSSLGMVPTHYQLFEELRPDTIFSKAL